MDNKKMLHMVAFSLTIVGALNWGLVGLFNQNVLEAIFSIWPGLVRLIYILVGVSAGYLVANHKNDCKSCAGK